MQLYKSIQPIMHCRVHLSVGNQTVSTFILINFLESLWNPFGSLRENMNNKGKDDDTGKRDKQ